MTPSPRFTADFSDPLASRDVLDPADVNRTVSRIAHQVLEHTNGGQDGWRPSSWNSKA
jgi:hypothetical protein